MNLVSFVILILIPGVESIIILSSRKSNNYSTSRELKAKASLTLEAIVNSNYKTLMKPVPLNNLFLFFPN